MRTLDRVKVEEAVSPSQLDRAVPRDLSIICLQCLQKQADRRYATAEVLADDLDRFLNGQPISCATCDGVGTTVEMGSEKSCIATMASCLLVTVVVTLTAVSWQWRQAIDARDRESERADSEASAKKDEAAARCQAQIYAANSALDRGIQSCREGKSRIGLLSMVRALELLPEDEPDLEFAIRANIDGWRRQVCKAQHNAGYGTAVVSLSFSPDGKSVLTGDYGNTLGEDGLPAKARLWDVERWEGPALWTVGHPAGIWSVAFSPDGKRVALGGFDGTAVILDVATGAALTPSMQHPGRVYAVAFSPDGTTLAVGGHVGGKLLTGVGALPEPGVTGELRLWDSATGTMIGEPHAFPFRVNCIAWHSSGQSLALGGLHVADEGRGMAGIAAIFEIDAGKLVGPAMVHPDAVGAIAFTPDPSKLATGCRDGLIRFWNHSSGLLDPAPLFQTRTINSLAFSSDGMFMAAASGHHEPGMRVGTGEVHIWNTATRARVIEPPFEGIGANSQKMHSIAFGDGDRKLAAVSEHGRAWLWTLPPGVQPVREWKFPRRSDVYHSPDGKKAPAECSADERTRV